MLLYLTNLVTFLRLLFLPVIMVLEPQKKIIALSLLFLCLISDFLDGYIARRFHCQSSFGEVFDPAVDKIFILSMCMFLYYQGFFKQLLFHAVFVRNFVQILSFIFVKSYGVCFYIKPSFFAKCCTCFIYALIFYSFMSYLSFFEENSFFSKTMNIIIVLCFFFECFLMLYYPFQFFLILSGEKKGFD